VLGDSEGGAQLDGLGTSGAPGPNAFLAKLDATGHPLWVRHFGVGAKVGVTRLAVDLEGACIVSGYAQGAARIENLVVGSAAKLESYYLAAKYLPDGSVAWARDLAYVKDLKPGDVCTDLGGNAYFTHTLDGAAVSILKLGRGGDVQWEKRYTFSSLPGRRTFLQASSEGFVYLAGDYYSNVDLDGRTLTSRGYSDIFVALLEATTSPWDFVRPNPITKPVATMPVVNPPSIQAPIASNAMIIPTSRGRMYITK